MSRQPPRSTINGGLKLPPFSPRIRLEGNPNEAPKHILMEKEASDFVDIIYSLLDNFDGPPFTIQRLCELCIYPNKHYKFIGKYLRAVEKTLLVTSTWDTFPIPSGSDAVGPSINAAVISGALLSTPSTPIFSPIPFLHGDARRSQSRSPPPSPLALAAIATGGSGSEADEKALGLVDELDDPSPGHLSDHMQPISSTTTPSESKPIMPSLGDRFISSSTERETDNLPTLGTQGQTGGDEDKMQVDDESEDKENKAA
ncbi:hypothetical protein QCA50_002968 [Cerrena zonata]|uniref:PPP4R2-domain-containing protein n=1 Tax=Cerrena zonata TaxID=2478898 RepID=A0AAW0GVD5_9APHY